MKQPGGKDKWRPGGPKAGELGRGASVGRYLVLGLLGKGGMGEVYAAYDPELDRKIALKLLRTRAGDGADPSEGRARLLREAQAIARLSDPNVVIVFDVGMFEDRVFLAMEFLDGHTVGYWLHAQPRGWREVLKVFVHAGQGLASAHKAGIVHRDFKPENVMIGQDGQVRVMDFGLARSIKPDADGATEVRRTGTSPAVPVEVAAAGNAVAEGAAGPSAPGVAATVEPSREWSAGSQDTRNLSRPVTLRSDAAATGLDSPLTMTGAMMGTPAYMAPEQFRGSAIDDRADQFAFCVALYEALYGERPFKGKSITDLTASVLAGKVGEAPTHARVPGWLRKVVLRGLRVDRNERHASMDALLAALKKDPAVKYRRWAAAGGVAMVVALLAGGLVRAERRQRTRCLGSEAKLAGIWELPKGKGALSPRKESIKKTFLATGKRYAPDSFNVVLGALDRYVTDWNQMHRDSCEATNVRGEQSAEVLDLRSSCLNDRFAEVRALTNVLAEANGEVVEKSVQAAQSLRPIEQCADITALKAVVKPPDDPAVRKAVAEVRGQLAEVKALTAAGKYKSAAAMVGPLVDRARAIQYEALVAETLLQMAELRTVSGQFDGSEQLYEDAVWFGESSRHDEVVAQAAAELVWVSGYTRQFRAGERWARHAAAVLKRLGPGHDVLSGWRANNLAVLYEREGRFQDALAISQEAVAIKEKALGSQHIDVAISLDNVGLALFRLGHVEEALAKTQRALEILRSTVGPEHPEVAIRLVNAAEFQHALGRNDEAKRMAEEALAIWHRELEADEPLIAYGLTVLGNSLIDGGHSVAATAPLERALVIRKARDPQPDLLAETQFALARALWTVGKNRNRAIAIAGEAAGRFEGVPGRQAQLGRVQDWIRTRPSAPSLR
jgi:eukaryotic-like serine/threonine-protein kinase